MNDCYNMFMPEVLLCLFFVVVFFASFSVPLFPGDLTRVNTIFNAEWSVGEVLI